MMNGGDLASGTVDPVPGTMDQTSGSDDRASRPLRDPLMKFDLREEIDRLSCERQWDEDGRNSIVLAKDARLRVVLSLVREGARIGDNDAEGPMSVQVLGGRVVARRDRQAVELADGEMATIEAGAAWAVEAQEDSAILLTITWPPERAGV
jgi:quercetin dioxygenase-like cupin family protein